MPPVPHRPGHIRPTAALLAPDPDPAPAPIPTLALLLEIAAVLTPGPSLLLREAAATLHLARARAQELLLAVPDVLQTVDRQPMAPNPDPVHALPLNGPEAVPTIHVPPVAAGRDRPSHPVVDRLLVPDGLAAIRDLCLAL